MKRFRRLLCRAFGHVALVSIQGRVGQTKALASLCPRCKAIVAVRAASRSERRRAMYGRP